MPKTRHQRRIIDLSNQNASQPVYRLSSELISEIFLLAQPDVTLRQNSSLDGRIRYLVHISSVTGHFRCVALGCGKLWTLLGFNLPPRPKSSHCKRMFVVAEAFLKRSQGCGLHFFFSHAGSWDPEPDQFYYNLLALLSPHSRRVKTFTFNFPAGGLVGSKAWDRLDILLRDAVNVNKLTLRYGVWRLPLSIINALHSLKELDLGGLMYDESVHDVMKQVEILHFSGAGKWLEHSVKLKRLIIGPSLWGPPKSRVRLEDLMYLQVSKWLYQRIVPNLFLPHLRHLHVFTDYYPSAPSAPQAYHHSFLRTLCLQTIEHQFQVGQFSVDKYLIIANPQLEYLEIDWSASHRSVVLALLSELSDPSQLPSGVPSFPGPSLKFMRLSCHHFEDSIPLSKCLSSLLSKAPHLKLDLTGWVPAAREGLMNQFPSQVCCSGSRRIISVEELYESTVKDYD